MMTKPLLLLFGLAACGADVPDNPTYFVDVQPILAANCVRCHGADPIDPKAAKFRLDRHVELEIDPVGALPCSVYRCDAWDYAQGNPSSIERVAINHESPAMPPDYSLTDRQQEILARWIQQGAKKGKERRTNHSPRIELISPIGASTADQNLDTTFRAWDDDLDGLNVRLWAHDLTNPAEPDYSMGPLVGGGQRSLSIDTGTLAHAHTFEIYAILDDGYDEDPANNQTRMTLIPELAVDHGLLGTAPRVALTSPNGGETLIGSATITWTASDPDIGDSLTFSLDLMRVASDGTTSVQENIATGLTLPAPPAGQPYSTNWNIPASIMATDGTGAAIPYKIRVTAHDATQPVPNERSDESDLPIYIAQAVVTTYEWANVRPIFDQYCKDCHAAAGKTPAIDYFCMLKYDTADPDAACEASDQGVFDVKGQVYQRMVVAKTMPPATELKPSQSELDIVGNWILGGAPKGMSQPADTPPTLSWTSPGASVVIATVVTSNRVAKLEWTVADVEGLKSTRVEYTKLAGTGFMSDCSTQTCPPANPTISWSSLSGAGGTVSGMSATQMFDWTLADTQGNRGCYCVRGYVTDSVDQTPAPIAATKAVQF